MYDQPLAEDTERGGPARAAPHRARGRAAAAALRAKAAGARLVDLDQSGAAKEICPALTAPFRRSGFPPPRGGQTCGGRVSCAVDLAPGARVLATTQTGERDRARQRDARPVEATFFDGTGPVTVHHPIR